MLSIILRSSLIVILISATDKHEGSESFILAQHWPVTSWKSRSLKNVCKTSGKATWSIRGLFQPATGYLNSNNCTGNSSLTPRLLKSIKDDLQICWPDFLEDEHKQLMWEREWSRHGRCTQRFQESPLEYFSMGCHLWRKYPIQPLLASGNIFPGKSYNLARIHDALKLGSNQIDTLNVVCQKIQGKYYLAEIQICFSKNFTETICNSIIHVPRSRGFIGSCPRYGRIRYPNQDELNAFHQSGSPDVAMFQQSGPPSLVMFQQSRSPSMAVFQQSGPPSVATFQQSGPPSVATFQQSGPPSVAMFQLSGPSSVATFQPSRPRSAKQSQAPISSNCKPGKTFRGTPDEAMLCIRQLLQRRIIKAKLARARKNKTIEMKNLKYRPQARNKTEQSAINA